VQSVLLFANPIAGRGRGKRIAVELRRALTRAGYDVRAALDRADQIKDQALRDAGHVRAAIAVGGDGTLRGVAQRLYDHFPHDTIPPLLVVPLGTANLMGKHLGVDWQDATMAEQVVAAINARNIVTLDAATANDRLFLLMAGIGIDAHIVHELDRVRSGPIDITSYALPAAIAFQSYNYEPLEVEVDGRRVFGPAPAMAFIGNVPEYGTGFPILPKARSDDGVLDVCVIPCSSRLQLIKLFLLAATGEHIGAEGVVYTTGRRVRVASQQSVPVQIDGDPGGHTPLDIQMLPTRMPFIVPGAMTR
jgi:YegS/Rv2252/BmrU family lipid kinase